MSGKHLVGYFLVGPTAAGKSAVAQCIAAEGDYEILSADSMLVYQGMDIGTAKPGPDERARVPHHGLDLQTPDKVFNVWMYRRHAEQALRAIAARGRPALVVGGTGLYVKALTHGLTALPASDPRRRRHWQQVCERQGPDALATALRERSPALAEALAGPPSPRRLIRALELAEAGVTAPPASWGQATVGAPLAGLSWPPAVLRTRIEVRVTAMYRRGLLDEVRALLHRYTTLSETARQAIGYAEAIDVLAGKRTAADAGAETVGRTRRLAKRQRTWFRHQADVRWIEGAPHARPAELAAAVRQHWETHGPTPIQP